MREAYLQEVSTNQLKALHNLEHSPPLSEDNDEAVFRRVCIIEFKHKFDRNVRFDVTPELVEDCRRRICEAVRSKTLKAEEWNHLPAILDWKHENSVDYILSQVLVHEPGKSVTLPP
ncbi:MAG: hypothetical protein IIT80_03165 [Aeriscardovia sp.]|nr:hypothetical protein [Aeriscardovia sp.]